MVHAVGSAVSFVPVGAIYSVQVITAASSAHLMFRPQETTKAVVEPATTHSHLLCTAPGWQVSAGVHQPAGPAPGRHSSAAAPPPAPGYCGIQQARVRQRHAEHSGLPARPADILSLGKVSTGFERREHHQAGWCRGCSAPPGCQPPAPGLLCHVAPAPCTPLASRHQAHTPNPTPWHLHNHTRTQTSAPLVITHAVCIPWELPSSNHQCPLLEQALRKQSRKLCSHDHTRNPTNRV